MRQSFGSPIVCFSPNAVPQRCHYKGRIAKANGSKQVIEQTRKVLWIHNANPTNRSNLLPLGSKKDSRVAAASKAAVSRAAASKVADSRVATASNAVVSRAAASKVAASRVAAASNAVVSRVATDKAFLSDWERREVTPAVFMNAE